MATKRVPPSHDQLAELIDGALQAAAYHHDVDIKTDEAFQGFVSWEDAVENVRLNFRTTRPKATEWLTSAFEGGAIIKVQASHNGRHLSRWAMMDPAKFPKEDPAELGRYMLDTINPARDQQPTGTLDAQGVVHLVDFGEDLPDGHTPAPDLSNWVTTRAALRQTVDKMTAFTGSKLLQHQAGKIAEDAYFEHLHGDDLKIIRALFHGLGIRHPDSVIEPRISTWRGQDTPILGMTVRGRDITRLADRLRQLGINENMVWGDR